MSKTEFPNIKELPIVGSNIKELSVVGSNINNNIKFTDDQQSAIDGVISFIAEPFNPAKIAVGLIGAGGTGKTFITDYIIKRCKFSDSVIKCSSPTHKACRVFSNAIGGKPVDTIQSVLGLRLDLELNDFNPDKPQFNPKSKPKLDNTKLLIVDEASMLPAKLVTYINKVCREKEIKIIFIGDGSQLAPVNERQSIAFRLCYTVYELIEVVRQDINNPIGYLLELLRDDINNKRYSFLDYIGQRIGTKDINDVGEGFIICGPEQFKTIIDESFTNKDYTSNIDMYRIISYTNNNVTRWNHYVRNTIVKDADTKVITKNDLMMSYRTIVDEYNTPIINNSEEYIIDDIVDYVDPTYDFKGFLIRFQQVHGGFKTKPLFVIDHTDAYTVRRYYDISEALIKEATKSNRGIRVSKWKAYYQFKEKFLVASTVTDQFGKLLISRDLDYGFAITSHKSQGSTYNNVFVDINDMVYTKTGVPYANQDDLLRRLYVACSRAKTKLILCYGNHG